ncbi:divergent polysaccharide deacetylase family protein [Oricola sp.]|uniref:divergent polysaccharide deacetylase family protein n=1 Tax=Oricola sp. TaxID=1979950 RepID=UPI0025D5273E|nr:divergent polysaccharide deacetylase family protein [Oricola sp.]MCI5077652.1 divergent polysaccharide deacetylase family protein [Oricola sp.]
MTDLNAPLGQTGRKPAGGKGSSSPRPPRKEPSFGAPFAAIAIFATVATLNAYAFLERAPLPRAASISLAETNAQTAVAEAASAPKRANDTGVEVIYAEPRRDAAQPETETVRAEPDPTMPEGRVSEGGPKVIVIRDPAAASVGQPAQIAHLPDDGAIEDSAWGPLPVRTDEGRRPMDIYARPWSEAGGKRIAIVIGGLGLSQSGTLHALEALPPEVTLAFSPEGNSLTRWMRQARKQGHELLLQVPMEPFGYPANDPGPHTLTVGADTEANLDNLRWALAQITNYTGVVNYLGGRFGNADAAIAPVLREIGARGLLYFNDGTAGGEKLGALASALDVPYVSGDVTLDETRDPAAITDRLKELEKRAAVNGFAVGTGSALEVTVDAVADWANGAKKRGFEIVGISALAR